MSYWNIKFYNGYRELETVRGLTEVQADTLMQVFEREGLHAQAIQYDSDGKKMLDSRTVNNKCPEHGEIKPCLLCE